MHVAEQPVDPQLLERIEALQVRIEDLERIVLAPDEPVEAASEMVAEETVLTAAAEPELETEPEPGPGPADGPALRDTSDPLLRERQREAER